MRTYYPKYLTKEIYKRVLSVAADYFEMIKIRKLIEYDRIQSMPNHESGVHSAGISKPVESITEQIEKHTRLLNERIQAVEYAIAKFNIDEQNFIQQNIMQSIPIPYCGYVKAVNTAKSVRHDFLILLAIELGEILE